MTTEPKEGLRISELTSLYEEGGLLAIQERLRDFVSKEEVKSACRQIALRGAISKEVAKDIATALHIDLD